MTTNLINPSTGGAVQFTDNEYTASNRLLLEAGIRTAIPNNRAGKLPIIHQGNVLNWVDNTGKITPPNGNGDTYTLRVFGTFRFDVADTKGKAELDIGGNQNVIYPKSLNFNAAAGVDFKEAFEMTLYTLDTFYQNGATLYLTFEEDVQLHDITFFITNINRG